MDTHKRKEENAEQEMEKQTKQQKVSEGEGVHHRGHSQKSSILEKGTTTSPSSHNKVTFTSFIALR